GSGDLVVRSPLRGLRVLGAKPDSTETAVYVGLLHVKSYILGQMSS
ncbi:hypothetical protein AVEN_267956-1, partial [Araneus ventricosus]